MPLMIIVSTLFVRINDLSVLLDRAVCYIYMKLIANYIIIICVPCVVCHNSHINTLNK